MNGIYDLGGVDGLGPVDPPAREPVFRAEWEKAAFTMFSAMFRAGYFGLDEFRFGIEKMNPAEYLESPYYWHWIQTFIYHGLRTGRIDADERREEIARMLSGAAVTEEARAQAARLLETA